MMAPPCCGAVLFRMTLLAISVSAPPFKPMPPPHEPHELYAMRLLRTTAPEPPTKPIPPPPFPPLHPPWLLCMIWLFLIRGPPPYTPMPPPDEQPALYTMRFPVMVGDEPDT